MWCSCKGAYEQRNSLSSSLPKYIYRIRRKPAAFTTAGRTLVSPPCFSTRRARQSHRVTESDSVRHVSDMLFDCDVLLGNFVIIIRPCTEMMRATTRVKFFLLKKRRRRPFVYGPPSVAEDMPYDQLKGIKSRKLYLIYILIY